MKGVIAFVCGHCSRSSAGSMGRISSASYLNGILKEVDYTIDVSISCSVCERQSILHYVIYGFLEGKSGHIDLINRLKSDNPEGDYYHNQTPPLIREMPAGVPLEIASAWREAEIAFSKKDIPTLAAIAYRRVIELGAKALDSEGDEKRIPLGQRIANLTTTGDITTELRDLVREALKFGNEAAHGSDALHQRDAEITKDLAEAFLRQAFSIPMLLADARAALAKRAELGQKSQNS